MLDHLRLQYAKEFRCIGPQCEDTCCHGLDVLIDQAAYQKYRGPQFQHFVQHLEKLPAADSSRYARIKMPPSLCCPFFSSGRWCSIQQQFGEEYLPQICSTYPRVARRIDGLLEKALLLSCSEAARLVLLNPELMPQVEAGNGRSPYDRFLNGERPARTGNASPHRFLWELREFTLLLLRDRSYPLWQRLFILGLFCKRLKHLTAASQVALVPSLLKTYATIAKQGTVRSLLDQMPVQSALQLTLVIEVVGCYLQGTDGSHVRFRECVQDFMHGVKHDVRSSIESLVPAYTYTYSAHYMPFMDAHPYLLENYLINYVFRTRFPFGVTPRGQPNDAETEFLTMCTHYGVIKGLLIGMAGYHGDSFSATHVVKLVSSFAKAVEHSTTFPTPKQLNLDNTNALAALLKN